MTTALGGRRKEVIAKWGRYVSDWKWGGGLPEREDMEERRAAVLLGMGHELGRGERVRGL